MHTIKGNARTYGLSYVTDSVHIAETSYDKLRKNDQMDWDANQLLDQLKEVKQYIDRYAFVSKNALKRGGSAQSVVSQDQLIIDQSVFKDIQSKIASVLEENLDTATKESLASVNRILSRLDTSSLEEVLEDVCRSTKSLAKELGKPEPTIEIKADGVLIKNHAKELLNNVFMHNFRNALDHGIESADVRTSKGKSPEGHIILEAIEAEDYLEITLRDDGQGVSLKKLKEKALDSGELGEDEELTRQELANLVFSAGISTAESVTGISGRGVGMDAVKQFIEDSGGEVAINLIESLGEGTQEDIDLDYAPFQLSIKLPNNTFVTVE
jgi:chemotaxis protein histidine kinase CheA